MKPVTPTTPLLLLSCSGKLVAIGDDAGTVYVVETERHKTLRTFKDGDTKISALCFVEVAEADSGLEGLDKEEGDVEDDEGGVAGRDKSASAAARAKQTLIVAASTDGSLRAFDVSTNEIRFVIKNAHQDAITQLASTAHNPAADNRTSEKGMFYSAGRDSLVKKWRVQISAGGDTQLVAAGDDDAAATLMAKSRKRQERRSTAMTRRTPTTQEASQNHTPRHLRS